MDFVAIVTLLAVAQYVWFGIRVGQARGTYNIEAPAVSGHPMFERHFRIHQNTLEQLIIFLPALWAFAWYVKPWLAGLLGLGYLAGRFLYERGYLADPNQRETGVIVTTACNGILLIGALLAALIHAL